MAENRILKLGKQVDFQCQQMEYQLAAYTNCNQGEGRAVLQPVYYRHIYRNSSQKFRRFATQIWGIPEDGRSDEETALAGIGALENFIMEIGLPVTLRDLGANQETDLKGIADSCVCMRGAGRGMTSEEILQIFKECY